MNRSNASLRQRLVVAISLLVAASLAIGAIGIWGISRVHEDYTVALQGYAQLREVYEVGVHVAAARDSLGALEPDLNVALREISLAESKLNTFAMSKSPAGMNWLRVSEPVEEQLHKDLTGALADLPVSERMQMIDRALADLAILASQVRTAVQSSQDSAARERRITLWLTAIASILVACAAIFVGVRHYRSVMVPIDRLAAATRQFAAGNFERRVSPSADREFASLADDFNHMADELAQLYSELERKVAEKSKELVRSERLASVGFLAAGVAHEINNPLGIIAAYAERSLQSLRKRPAVDDESGKVERSLEIICEEAFRCKEITDRLLTLARPGGALRQPASIAALAREVVNIVGGLPQYRNTEVVLESDQSEELTAVVNETEIKQVILNLLFNALEAVGPAGGRISIAVCRNDRGDVELTVIDNGQGMEGQTLDRLFEPFFTRKRDSGPGTGLGLSICHAIIESHGGQLRAASGGLGKGSKLTLTLPPAQASKETAVG